MGSQSIPFAEPPWLDQLPSPLYNESHRKWQKHCRAFFEDALFKDAMDWEREADVPPEVYAKFAEANMLIPNLPTPLPVKWLKEVGIESIGPLKVEDFDYNHIAIYCSELVRCGVAGPPSAVTAGFRYGVPPLLHFASASLQKRILPDLLLGRKRICIAITEPDAGSDVANVTTTAVKSKDGKHYIVNGSKKWITNGYWSDYATMCVRTGSSESGATGLSVLLVPLKGHKGVSMRRMKISGQVSSGTTFIELEDVQVPVENLIGEEGQGMRYIMTNFNHERLTIAISVMTRARVALAAAFEYTMKREAFGQPLIQQAVVRHRLAKAGADLESCYAWVESLVYQFMHMAKKDADQRLGGLTALAKAKSAMVLNKCVQSAQLLFGGNGFTESGQGELVARMSKEVAGARIPGGSEDVMLDLAIRQLYKNYQKAMKDSSSKL